MKQWIEPRQFQEITPDQQEFITTWKNRKYPDYPNLPNIGMCIELLIALTYNLHFEDSDGRFFNKILSNTESVIGWEGQELIDILWYEIVDSLKRRMSLGTFNETVPEKQTAT